MIAPALAAFTLLLAPEVQSTAPSNAFILTCDVSKPGGPAATRTFRIAPKVFQERKAGAKAFGPNLCLSFPCSVDRAKLEGTISSASVIFTVTADPAAGSASWRSKGAANAGRSSGACKLSQEPVKH